jgi:hypothetical protein
MNLPSTKLAKISHNRCYEYDSTTFVMIPYEWSIFDFNHKVKAAQEKYLQFFNKLKTQDAVPFVPYKPDYAKADKTKTIAEIETEHQEKLNKFQEYEEFRVKASRSFTYFLQDEGMFPIWAVDADYEVDIDWGHAHGSRLDYHDKDLEDFYLKKDLNNETT